MLAGCGLPGFANFVGEIMVLFGAWSLSKPFPVLAAWRGMIIGAVYMLRAVRQILHGPLLESGRSLTDASHLWRRLPFVLLLGSLLLFGVFPRLLTDKIQPSVEAIVRMGTSTGPLLPRQMSLAQESADAK